MSTNDVNDGRVHFMLEIDEDLLNRAQEVANDMGITFDELLEAALKRYVKIETELQ
ncbi:MAG: hypothetical protein ABJA67_14895 [Chthonomonadales bacterium]